MQTMLATPNRIPITREICKFLEQNGLLTGRYELIDGEIISKMSQNPPHALTVMLITTWLMRVFGDVFVRCQLAIEVGAADPEINGPEPDVAALRQPITAFASHHPGAADILLLVEVSDSTLSFDLRNKALLYARAGVVEYWVADINGRRIITHRNPTSTGYGEIAEYAETAFVASRARPNNQVRVADLLPPAASS